MATYFTDFGDELAGALATSADWTSVIAGTWTSLVQNDGGAASGKSVIWADNTWGDAFNAARNDAIAGSGTTGDIEVVAKFKVATAASWASETMIGPVLSNQADSDDCYCLARDSGNMQLYYFADNATSATIGSAFAPGFTITNDTYLWVRIGRSGTTIRAKIWADGSSEPGAWMGEGTNTTLSNVMAAFVVNEADSGPCTWEIFGVGTSGDEAPVTDVVPTAAVTGTATATINEADIVAGGKTVIVTMTDDTYVPAAGTGDISFIANALGGTTDTTSFSITLPTTASGDILILEFSHRGTGDGTIGGTSITTGGLTWTLKHSQLFATSAFSGKTYWTRATGDHSGQTVTGASLTDSCAAILTQYRGAVASGDPLSDATIVGEENASGNETQAEITTASNKALVVLVVVNSPDLAVANQTCTSPGALTERAERLSTGGTDASISHASAAKATAGATGALTWTQTNAASGSWAYAIKPLATTPFDSARQAIIDGLDSAQSEGTGWNAEVRDNLAVTTVVRTSDTAVTITLSAQAAYNITAQETITVTVPATALVAGNPIVATPTFTVGVGSSSKVSTLMAHYS